MKILIHTLFIISFPFHCFSHGVTGTYGHGGFYTIASYDDGEAMSYAETKIIAPDSKLPFSSGWTDRNGRFCFFPDVAGEYLVIIKDGMGHRVEIKIPFNPNMETGSIEETAQKKNHTKSGRFEKKILCLSIIFLIFGCFFWWKGKCLSKEVMNTL